jgi:lipopolysaccharide biosynthesis protein
MWQNLEKIPRAHRLLLRRLRIWMGYPYRAVWSGLGARRGDRLCLFAHWDRDGVVDDHVIYYLERIADLGFVIDFVTCSNDLEVTSLRRVRKMCRRVFLKLNQGWDFASWRAAAPDPTAFQEYDGLLLANDSVFGPFHDLGPILGGMATQSLALCGLTDSYEIAHHLQSYFLYLPRPTLVSRAFTAFWSGIDPTWNKAQVVERGEIGLSQQILQGGGTLKTAFPYEAVAATLRAKGTGYQYHEELKARPLYLPQYAWDVLLETHGCPFVKTEILKQNYVNSARVWYWRDLIPQHSRHLIPMIERHLRRVALQGPGLAAAGEHRSNIPGQCPGSGDQLEGQRRMALAVPRGDPDP